MNKLRNSILLSAITLGAAFTAFTGIARADAWDKMTKVTVTEPIEVPGAVLQPGTYTFKILNMANTRHIVEVSNERDTHLITTISAINTERLEPTGKTVFAFYETPAGQPPAVKRWYYPGDNFGQEFVYKKGRATQLAQSSHQQVTTEQEAQNTPPPAPEAVAPAPAPEPAPEVARNEPPAQAPPAPAPAPEVAAPEAPAPAVLPQTASDIPLLTLLGLLSLGAAAGLSTLKSAKKVG